MNFRIFATILFFVLLTQNTFAQYYERSSISQYYRNDYLWNPAFAGEAKKFRMNAILNKSWIGFTGAPQSINLAIDKNAGKNSGFGFMFESSKGGLLQNSYGAAGYSYSFPLSKDSKQKLFIGGSLNAEKTQLNTDPEEPDDFIQKYNSSHQWSFNGQLGLGYKNNGFTIASNLNNLRLLLNDESIADVGLAQFRCSYAYTFLNNESVTIAPMIDYRLYKNADNIYTLGTQVEYENIFHASLYYQSHGNIIGGAGVELKDVGELNFFYSTGNSEGYNRQFEVGLKAML